MCWFDTRRFKTCEPGDRTVIAWWHDRSGAERRASPGRLGAARLQYRAPLLPEDSAAGLCLPRSAANRYDAPAASTPSPSRLRQEMQERLVEGRRILVAHKVGGLGNDDQTTAGNTPPEHL